MTFRSVPDLVALMASSSFPPLDGTYGATEIGSNVALFLFGIQTIQARRYFLEFPQDARPLKTLVGLVWLLELGQSICASHVLYTLTVTFYGQPPAQVQNNPPHSIEFQNTFLAISLTIVQIFFANRVRILSGNPAILLLALVFSLFSLVVGLISEAQLWTSTAAIATLEVKMRWVRIAGMAVTPILDILIASSLCFCLWRRREEEFRHKTHKILDTLMIWTIETTLLTSVCAIMQVILFLTGPELSYIAFQNIQSKLFANSMLAVLNGRRRFNSHVEEMSNILSFNLSGGGLGNVTTNSTWLQHAASGDDRTVNAGSATPIELERRTQLKGDGQ
ncbi:O-methylsterigmatocystin oxidoreductase [Mycena sanguinolenta]|uniref:O-methylsterigmatocystin oxidoreductase n=1 Tax=Mycena sanguinolenta TaxID=230812 RepID=A0A8H6YSS8_9AGAR|nr:O-methylsterigmatocystin oxidoreductase [Mycena sanguinolenta]